MRAFKVDMDGVEEVEIPDDFARTSMFGWDWDCVRLGDGHDAWVRDDALFQPSVSVATIGGHRHVALPAYVLGAAGERTVGATLSIDAARALVTSRSRVR